ncbi:hypothetical protein [Sutcliffiella horikoshii]|uniref:hypothetical protein n=1 Tax=Sutcliffiella horikoshii TaxID=79883 RepID=UPI001CFC5B3E|nr:hypothetical protein [Sutcliffiella horikoshii]
MSLAILTIFLVLKGLQLWSYGSDVDGSGIGVFFLGLEINDRVLEVNIPTYAIGFFIAGLCTLLLSITILTRLLFKSGSRTPI